MNKIIDSTDKAAIVLSMLCVAHCTVLPIALIILPSVSSLLLLNDEIFHSWLLFAVIPVSLFATVSGYIHHQRKSIITIGAAGMVTLASVVIGGHDVFNHTAEVVMTLIGSSLIAYAHLSNFNLRRAKTCQLTHQS
jgi:uncharacterized membrane protein (DUF373 family)